MKKRLLLFVFMLLPLAVNAAVAIDGIYYNLNSSDKTAEVALCPRNHRYSGDIVIPSSVNNGGVEYSVTGIVMNAFSGCPDLSSVTIPHSVTKIGKYAFNKCIGLTSIVVSEGNPTYDSRENCNAIIETASNKLLFGCMNTVIPNGVTSIDENAFKNCSTLTAINIPNSITSIEKGLFDGCSNLVKVELNSNAIVSKKYKIETESSIRLFFGDQIEEYILGEDVTDIGDGAFCGCSAVTSIRMSDNVTTIGESTFQYCSSLTSINMSESLTSIGNFAFARCFNLKSITIPASLTSMSQWSFGSCNLTKVVLNSNAIVSKADVPFVNYFGSMVEEYVLGEGVTSIGKYAFAQCPMTSIIIPHSMTSIGEGAFWNCGMADMYCYAEKVPEIGSDNFKYLNYNATLHVPATSVEAYRNADQWRNFANIVPLTDNDPRPAGVKGTNNMKTTSKRYYTLDGKCTATPRRGLNIIKTSDGTTKKVVM